VIVDLFITTLTDRPASFKAAGNRPRYFCRLQLEHKAATHCSRDKYLVRPNKKKKKQKVTIKFLY
jgi:hypothetical protein